MNNICSIVGCSNPAVPGRKSCGHVDHQRIEDVHNERGQSRFQLKERYERSQLAHPNDAIGEQVTSISEIIDDDEEEEFEPGREGPVPVTPNSTTSKPRIRTQFGRRRTHNEQLFVAPCGIIVARETFYHAEALYSVIVCIYQIFSFKFLFGSRYSLGNDKTNLPAAGNHARTHILRQQLFY